MRIGGLPRQVGIGHVALAGPVAVGRPVDRVAVDEAAARADLVELRQAAHAGRDVVVARRTEAVTQLEVVEPLEVLHAPLVRQAPRSGHRGEVAPLLALRELRRTIAAHRGRKHVLALEVVVDAPEIGEQDVVGRIVHVRRTGVRGRTHEGPRLLGGVEIGQSVDPGVERTLLGDDVLLSQQHVQVVIFVRDELPEIIAQRIGVAHAAARHIVVVGRRGSRNRRTRTADLRIVGRKAVERIGLLAVVLHAGLDLQAKVVDDLPREARVGVPVGALALAVRIRNGDRRHHGVRGVLLQVVAALDLSLQRNGRVEHGVLQTARGLRTRVVERVGARAADLDARIADVEVERDALVGLELRFQAQVVTAVIRTDHDRLVVETRIGGVPLELVAAARNRQVVVELLARTAEKLVHPVVALHAVVEVDVGERSEVRLVVVRDLVLDGGQLVLPLGELRGVERLHLVLAGDVLEPPVYIVVYVHLALLAALGGDQHDAVGAARTVDGRRKGVFQNVDRLDFRRGDVADALHGESVDDIERRAVRRERTRTAHADADFGVGISLRGRDLHTGHAARHRLGDRGHGHLLERLGIHRGDRTHDIAAFHGGVTHDHHVVHRRRLVFEPDVDLRFAADGDALRLHTDIGDHQRLLRSVGYVERPLPVDARTRSQSRTVNDHRSSDNRFARRILDDTSDFLSRGRGGQTHTQQEQQGEL